LTLVIKNCKPGHSGEYFAKLFNDAGEIQTGKAKLVVNQGPVFIKVPEPIEPLKKDESVKFEFIVDGPPKPTISWLINDKEVELKDEVTIEKDVKNDTYTMTIPKINPSIHAGMISIKATNIISTAQHDINLIVLDEKLQKIGETIVKMFHDSHPRSKALQ
jgi:hypothetical protein